MLRFEKLRSHILGRRRRHDGAGGSQEDAEMTRRRVDKKIEPKDGCKELGRLEDGRKRLVEKTEGRKMEKKTELKAT